MAKEMSDALKATLSAQGVDLGADGRQTIGGRMPFDEALASISDLPRAHLGTEEERELVVLSELGRGGMGVVLLAKQKALGREVAVKRCGKDGESVQTLVREARVMGRLEHPNVIPVHGLLADDEGPAVVMKRVSGVTWEDSLRMAPAATNLDRHLEVFLQLCNAVAFAHSRDVLHRDIKPANVLLGEYGEVYLADWGLAQAIGAKPTERVSGSPAYMAPEMLEGEADERTDVYLLGATLYQLLTGRAPHRGSLAQAIDSVRRAEPLVLPPSVPADLAAICIRACAADPAERFGRAADLRTAVRSHVRLSGTRSLLRTAHDRAEQVRPGRAREAIDQAFTEARFGFEQAIGELEPLVESADDAVRANLREELERSIQGRERLLGAMARIELERQQPESALALLGAMRAAPKDLLEEAEHLAEQLSTQRERLSKLEADLDPQVGAGERSWAQLLLAVGILVVTLLFAVVFAPRRDPSPLRLAIVGGVVFTVIATVAGIWRRRTEWNLVNRRIAQVAVLASAASALQRLVALSTGVDSVHVLMTDAFLLGMAGMSLTPFHRAGPVLTMLSLGIIGVGLVDGSLVDEFFVGFAVGVPAVLLLARAVQGTKPKGDS